MTVAKTFAEKQDDEAGEYSEEFKKELDSRYEEYIKGGKLVSEAEVNRRIKNIINGKSKKLLFTHYFLLQIFLTRQVILLKL